MYKLGVKLRRFENEDARDVCDIVRRGQMVEYDRGETRQEIDDLCYRHGESWVMDQAKNNYMFVLTMHSSQESDMEQIEGCGEICIEEKKPRTGLISAVSVVPEYRYLGLGRMIMETLEAVARQLNLEKVELQAPVTSCGFYKIMGYVCRGTENEEDTCRFCRMEKALTEG